MRADHFKWDIVILQYRRALMVTLVDSDLF
jgi:hypothetical protein